MTDADEPALVPLALLRDDMPIRGGGLDPAHVDVLVASGRPFPPILVHRATLCVIDGRHRVRAAAVRGAAAIAVRFFDGDENAAYVLAVRSNSAHGLPLSMADRKAATRRVIDIHPEWSDRRIGVLVGLDHKTVGVVRRTGSADPGYRVGRDGRVRRVRGAAGPVEAVTGAAAAAERAATVRRLRGDPSLRFTDSGRTLLRWLDAGPDDGDALDRMIDSVPDDRLAAVVAVARANALHWRTLAAALRDRAAPRHREGWRERSGAGPGEPSRAGWADDPGCEVAG